MVLGQLTTSSSIPTPDQPLTDDTGRVSQVWYRYWLSLLNRTNTALSITVTTGIAAAGATQATATALTARLNQVVTVALNAGVRLAAFGGGLDLTVWNDGANPLNVYPPVGYGIDAAGVNAPYSLPVGKSQIFTQLTPSLFRTLQLG